MTVLFTNVRLLDLDAAPGMSEPTDVLVVGGLITRIGDGARAEAPADARTVDGRGSTLLMPGLVNAHFHSSVNHMKGALDSLPLELFMLYESPEMAELAPTPREAYVRTMLGAIEMLRVGVTAVQDDAFFVPEPTPEIIDAVMQAYRDAGIRATVALDQPELAEVAKLPFLGALADGDIKHELSRPARTPASELLALTGHLIDRWHGVDDGRLSAAVSVSAPQRVSVEYFAALDEISRTHDIPLFAHMLETKVQRVLAQEQPRFAGRSLVEWVHSLGLLNARTNVIHAVWVDEHDLDLIADSGAAIAHNPISNLRLGSGVAPLRAMLDRGIPVALGTDEAITDDSVNLWGVVKAAGLVHNITGEDPSRWPGAREVLRAATAGGAYAMGRSADLGAVVEGARADLVLIDLHTLPFTPLNDLPRQLVYCEQGASVRLTMVAGRVVAEDGEVRTVDEDDILAEARELFARWLPALAEARRRAERLDPVYRSVVAKSSVADVGMSRWIG